MKNLDKQFEEIGYKVSNHGKNYSLRKIGTNKRENISSRELDKKYKEIKNKMLIDDILRNGGF